MRVSKETEAINERLTDEQRTTITALMEYRSELFEAALRAGDECIKWWAENVEDIECTKCNEGKVFRMMGELYQLNKEK